MRGHVPINYHMLSDFRVVHQEALDDLLTQTIGSLMAAGAVRLERVAQDGMRVRSSAGAASFRGEQGLETCLEEARAQVERLAKEREHPDPGVTRRERAARERAARERQERVHEALAYLPQAQAKKERQRRTKATAQRSKVTKARVSTTDPQASVMKMPDGGFRPAYNVELATDSANGVIVGVAVTSAGTDAGQASPMEEQVAMRSLGTSPSPSVTSPAMGMDRKWRSGGNGWPPMRPKPYTGNGALWPSGRTHRYVFTECPSSAYEELPKSPALCSLSPWPTTFCVGRRWGEQTQQGKPRTP